MNIGIDARWIFSELSGIGVYTRELIRALTAQAGENHFVLFFSDRDIAARTMSETGAAGSPNFKKLMLPFGLFSPVNQIKLPRILREQQLDVFHSTNYMIPLAAFPAKRAGRIQCVTTIHDLIPLLFPEYAPRSRKRRLFPLYRLLMREIGRRSDVIITDSHCSRTDVIRHLRIATDREDRVLAIPVGVSPSFCPADKEALEQDSVETLKKKDAGGSLQIGPIAEHRMCRRAVKTVLWVGRTDPYKNLTGLIEAFAKLRENTTFPVRLRIAGPQDRRYPEAFQLAKSLGITNDIEWLGYVSDEQLVREYRQADVFVLPSRYEGFGLPVVEAMACGTPVICSNKGSLPEIAGDAAIQVQPDDIIGMAEAIKRVLSEPGLARDMTTRGLQHATLYTWAETARQTLLAYEKAIE